MSVAAPALPHQAVVYPESDGEPMAENTRQARWIFVLYGNLTARFRQAADVFVAADLFWYPIEGDNQTRVAPDVLVAFGRPPGDRGSYLQWQENHIPPAVVFEILSPGNTVEEMMDKQSFYDEHGVQEYYLYNPDRNALLVYVRGRETLRRIRHQGQVVSERLGIRFDLTGAEMVVYHSDGRRFLTFDELAAEHDELAAEHENLVAEHQRTQKRAARLAELSLSVLRGTASAEERQELERLAGEGPVG